MRQNHKSILAIIAFLMLGFSLPNAQAQCKVFVKNSCLPQLAPYIHDGNYQAAILSAGEEAEIYKTIFAGQRYRLLICLEKPLPSVEFVVSDIRRNVLFDSRKNNNATFWDFKADASQQIKITIRVPKPQKQSSGDQELIFGCVGVLFGLLE